MSTPWWPLGTVAEIGWTFTTGRERAIWDGTIWITETGVGVNPERLTLVRRFAVLDPDDRTSVRRLLQAYWDDNPHNDAGSIEALVSHMQTALREIAVWPEEPLVTTRTGMVHRTGCYVLRRIIGKTWPWQARNDGRGAAQACSKCLPGGLPA